MATALRLFDNCILTIGYGRSIICDVQRTKYYLIPNSLALLFRNNILNFGFVTDDEDKKILDEYVDFLISNELCFYVRDEVLDNFAVINLFEWDNAANITNAIFEIKKSKIDIYIDALNALNDIFGTSHFELHFTEPLSRNNIDHIALLLKYVDFDNVNLIFSIDDTLDVDYVLQIVNNDPRIFRTVIYLYSNIDQISVINTIGGSLFIMANKFSYDNCGVINELYFTNNVEHITESHNHNTCLNRKISIDDNGNVKNCPNMPNVYGNIFKENLVDILQHKDVSQYWQIKKDAIKVCQDCEYRHICTDCRAFLKDKDDILSKPLKCDYDPYTNKWEKNKQELAKFSMVDGGRIS